MNKIKICKQCNSSYIPGNGCPSCHRKKDLLAHSKYYQSHKKEIIEKGREYRKRNAEALRIYRKNYNQGHREQRNAYSRQYHSTHRIQSAKYWQDNREYLNAQQKKWYQKHKGEKKLRNKERADKIKGIVFNHYGGYKCVCCGEIEKKFLVIDHINGNGNNHRKQLKPSQRSGYGFCSWLYKNEFPVGFQVLCHNYNMAKGFYGQCPHKEKVQI